MIAPKLEHLAVDIATLCELPGNPRKGDVDAVARSYATFGQQKPIVVQRRGRKTVVIDGNHQLKAARQLGWDRIAVSPFKVKDPNTGRVRAGTVAEADAYALAVNRTADLGVYDDELLAKMIESISHDADLLAAASYSHDDLLALLNGAPKLGLTDPDDVPESAPAKTKPGDLWLLGPHRILCGDSTVIEDVRRLMNGERSALMATDPPYLVDYRGGNHPQSWANKAEVKDKHWDDYIDPDRASDFFASFIRVALQEALTDRPAIYQWHAARRSVLVEQAWLANKLLVHQQIIWKKSRPVLGRQHFMWQHEPCMYGWVQGRIPALRPPNNATTIWDVNQRGESDGIHPTQKPVELFRRPMEWHTRPGGVIFEPFSGSGTSIIAAERTGRRCFALEISPAFVDVACRRYQEHTGILPRRESGGEVDFTVGP
jgi:DNA modification methylase